MSGPSCPFEQDVLLSMHGALPLSARLKVFWHCLYCAECRGRQAQYREVSNVLHGLRPFDGSAASHRAFAPTIRIALLAAAVALAAAAFSYYYTTHFLVARAAEIGPSSSVPAGSSAASASTEERCVEGAELPAGKAGGRTIRIKAAY